MRGVRNCNNCGATIELDKIKCPYCGTAYYDLSCMSLHTPFYLKINVGTDMKPDIIETKVYLSSIAFETRFQEYPEIEMCLICIENIQRGNTNA